MDRIHRLLLALLVLFLLASTSAFAQHREPLPAYFLSIILGFGTGHFYLQDESALLFLLLDGGTLTVSFAGYLLASVSFGVFLFSPSAESPPAAYYYGLTFLVGGALAYVGIRIWEIVDIFGVAKEQRETGAISLFPLMTVSSQGGAAFGVGLKYSF